MRIGTITYLIQAETGGPVKIGITRDIKQRLSAMQTDHPEVLRLVGYFKENYEKWLHDHYSEFRLRGEWFDERVLADITKFNEVIIVERARECAGCGEDFCVPPGAAHLDIKLCVECEVELEETHGTLTYESLTA